MGRITTSVGLVSGIDTGSIISQLIALDSRPVTQLQSRITVANNQKQAYSDLGTQLDVLKTIGKALTLPQTFAAASATSSDNNVLTATAANGASIGSFQFQVARLVTTQQAVSKGFADPSQSLVGAGTLTLSLGGGELKSQTKLADLNGGEGVQRGVFRITDRSGKTAAIDIGAAVTLDDVAKKINGALDVSVKAKVTSSGLLLTDLTGQAGNFTVQDSGDGTTAADLGIAGTAVGATLTGTSINSVGRATGLSALNDGRGIATAVNGGDDFRIQAGGTPIFDVNVANAKSVGDVLDAINTAGAGKVLAEVLPGTTGIRITDLSSGGQVTVATLNNSTAAADLGILGSGNTGLAGTALIAGIDSTLISSLNGGKGLPLGHVALTDRSGASQTIDLTGAKSVSDILDAINSQVDAGSGTHAIKVTASLNASGNGIQLVDKSGGTGNLTVSDVDSTSAQALGISGSFATTKTVVNGANLHRQYVTANTQLSDYNSGKGVALGKIRITNSLGASAPLDLQSINATKIGDVLSAINGLNLGVTASINDNGNGIKLVDTAGGASQLKVTDDGSTAAADLNIGGTATNNTLDGAFERTIAVTATDNLNTVATKINTLGFGVSATVISDGSPDTPYRLSLNATNSGRDGRFVFDAGDTKVATTNLVEAQDAAVFIGGQDGTNPLLITSSKNQLTNVIKGVTIDLHGTSTSPVTLNITRDSSNISTQLKNFVDGYNAISTKIATLTKFDTKTNTGALLLGDGTTQTIGQGLATLVNSVVPGTGKYKILSQLGVTLGDNNQLTYDSTKFDAAYAADPASVKSLFTKTTTGFGSVITKAINTLTDPVSGLITIQTQTLDTRNRGFQDQVTQLNALLDSKKTRLQKQFANLESTLSSLQSQQQALGSLGTFNAGTSTSSSRSSNSSSSSSSSSSS